MKHWRALTLKEQNSWHPMNITATSLKNNSGSLKETSPLRNWGTLPPHQLRLTRLKLWGLILEITFFDFYLIYKANIPFWTLISVYYYLSILIFISFGFLTHKMDCIFDFCLIIWWKEEIYNQIQNIWMLAFYY